jgi:hypothetical protein
VSNTHEEQAAVANVVPLDREGHAPTQALLPWYVAGRLDDAERAAVAAHLAGCERCRTEAELERHWAALLAAAEALPAGDPTGDTPAAVEQGLADMHRRLAALEPAPRTAGGHVEDDRRAAKPARPEFLTALVAAALARWRKVWPPAGLAPGWRWALGAQCGLIVLLLSVRLAPTPAGYHALGSGTVPANAVVMFRPESTEAQMRAALRDAHARLVGGPTATQAYLLWLPQADATALARLRTQPGVALAESLDAEPAP